MTVKLNSYINFNGNAKEAIEFYKSVFGGEVYLDTFEKFADSMPVESADKDKVMHAYLRVTMVSSLWYRTRQQVWSTTKVHE